MKSKTPAEQLILQVVREEMETLEASGYHWRERAAAMTRAANRLGLSNERVATIYDRYHNE